MLAKIQFLAAAALAASGRLSAAAILWEKGLNADPMSTTAWSDLGATYMTLGKLARSEYCLRRALKLDDKFGVAWFNLGSLFMRHFGEPETALGYYEKAMECDPTDEDAVCFAAEAMQRCGQKRSAVALLERAACNRHFQKVRAMLDLMAEAFRKQLDDIGRR